MKGKTWDSVEVMRDSFIVIVVRVRFFWGGGGGGRFG